MAQRARSGRQLAIEVPSELLQRLKAHATASDRPVSALVRRWIEAGLNGDLEGSTELPAAAGLADRVAALELAVVELQQQAKAPRLEKPSRMPVLSKPPELGPVPSPGASRITPTGDAPAGAITTAELAEALGMKRGSLNERIRRMGGARLGLELEGWCCVGSRTPEAGGPPRWLWEKA
mgnify:CR=1 FL=1|jgi:hypothetical protein